MNAKDEHSNDNRWRDRYLTALDEQEAQEKQYAEQRELLHRSMVRLSLAAEGQSPLLDKQLEALRQQLRQGEEAALPATIARLDEALLAFEGERQVEVRQLREVLERILNVLMRQPGAQNYKKSARKLNRVINRERGLLQMCPRLLEQLAELQQHILLDDPSEAPRGVLSRWFNKADPAEPTELESELELESQPGQSDRALFELNPNATLRVSETVSLQLRSIINELLGSVEAQSLAPEQVQKLQQRLQDGIDNSDLIPVLEQVRDLVMAAYVAATRAYAQYLNQVDTELADIYGGLGTLISQSQAMDQVSNTLQSDMLQQVSSIQEDVIKAPDLQTLQHQVQEKLGGIRAALASFQRSSKQEQPLHVQLKTLAMRLHTMEQAAQEHRQILAQQRHKALHDPLTGIPNREAFNERIEQELLHSQRYRHPLTLAVCDLDYFKAINDNFGHQAGDRVLKVISSAIAKRLRDADFIGRYGGEEFVILLPETTDHQAFAALDKIRAAIAKTDFRYQQQPVALTVSIGIAQYRQGESAEQLFARADRALYVAKVVGRNQSRLTTDDVPDNPS